MQIGDQVLFKVYSGTPAGHQPMLAPGDVCVIEMGDSDAGFTVRTVSAQPRDTSTEWVFAE